MSFYKDINLVKIPSNGTHKRKSINKLNHTVSEFSDNHLNFHSKESALTEINTSNYQ